MTRVDMAEPTPTDYTSPTKPTRAFELSIVVPTYNEAGNIPELLRRIARVMSEKSIPCEVLIVDDGSPDGTAEVARNVDVPLVVRVIERTGERGLAQSVVDGLHAAHGDCVLVMDADLQHPPDSIPDLFGAVRDGADFAIGSRYVPGGVANEFGFYRVLNSKIATWMTMPLVGRKVRDPMAGFFCLRRDLLGDEALNPIGYKIGLELLVKCKPKEVVEVPIRFSSRHAGESKLNLSEQINYLKHLRRLYDWRWPMLSQLAMFCTVGTCGMVVDLSAVALMVYVLTPPMSEGWAFGIARVTGIAIAMLFNFVLNRRMTFLDATRAPWAPQLLKFVGSCSVGAVINWSISTALYATLPAWRKAYLLFCIAGILVATASNFLLSRYLVFRTQPQNNP